MSDKKPDISPEARRASLSMLIFSSLLLVAIIASALTLPFKIASVVLAIAAIVFGIRTIVQQTRAKASPTTLVFNYVGTAIAGFLLLSSVSVLVLWPVYARYEDCVAGALTIQASERCSADLEGDIASFLPGLPQR